MELYAVLSKTFNAKRFARSIEWNIFGRVLEDSPRGARVAIRQNSSKPVKTLDEATVARLERDKSSGLTSAEILGAFADYGIPLSEATLRKYVQLGLLPRSVRVGRKGKHQGSQGIYPVGVVRQILRIKQMMAADYTIEQIQREFLFMRSEVQQLELTLEHIFDKVEEALRARGPDATAQLVTRQVGDARGISHDLLGRLHTIENHLTSQRRLTRVVAV